MGQTQMARLLLQTSGREVSSFEFPLELTSALSAAFLAGCPQLLPHLNAAAAVGTLRIEAHVRCIMLV